MYFRLKMGIFQPANVSLPEGSFFFFNGFLLIKLAASFDFFVRPRNSVNSAARSSLVSRRKKLSETTTFLGEPQTVW